MYLYGDYFFIDVNKYNLHFMMQMKSPDSTQCFFIDINDYLTTKLKKQNKKRTYF